MKRESELAGVLAIVAAGLGIDFVSGRVLAAFYAQTGHASWLGIGLAAMMYGLVTGMIVHMARRCGAQSVTQLLNRLPGGGMGKGAHALYGFILVLAMGMLLRSAGHMGALVLPVRRADLLGGALALLAAGVIAFAGERSVKTVGVLLVLLMIGFEIALLMLAQVPETFHYEIELRLKDNWIAAVGFALLHAAACLCLSAGLTVRFSGGRVRAGYMGVWAGLVYGCMLAAGNAALMARDERILVLKLPFVALSAGWGSVGFYLNAGLNWLFCVFAMAGLVYGLMPVCSRAKSLGK